MDTPSCLSAKIFSHLTPISLSAWVSLGFATQSPNDGMLATKLSLMLVVPWTGMGWMSILKELIQNISHCLPTDCPIDGVSIFYCNIFLVPAERLYMVPSLPHCVTHNRCQTTELANECCLPATQFSPDNTRLALPQGVLLPCSADMLWGWHITSPFLQKLLHKL